MPPRIQKTPHGDVTLTSRWMRDHYQLRASGVEAAMHWMFPAVLSFEQHGRVARHTFEPAPGKITVERELRSVCSRWQEHWMDKLQELPVDAPVLAGPAITTVGDLVQNAKDQRKDVVAAATLEKERHYFQHWLDELGADLPLAELDEQQLLQARGRLSKRLKPGTVNCSFAVMKSVLSWAVDQGLMARAPHRRVKRLKDTRTLSSKAWWTAEQVAVAFRCAEAVDVELEAHREEGEPQLGTATLLVALGCLLGLRYEEIIMMRWCDLDLDAKHPQTGQSQPVARVEPHDGWTPKDGDARPIPIHARLLGVLLRYRRTTGYVLNPAKPMPKRGGTKRVYRYDPKTVWEKVIVKVMAAGGTAISPGGMRHSFASNLLMAGESDVKVARWLGHADTTMVHRHYGHLLSYDDGINRVTIG